MPAGRLCGDRGFAAGGSAHPQGDWL